MSMVLVRAIRALATTTLIVGSLYVQHVARAQQVGSRHADLQHSYSPGSQIATYLIESGKPLLTLVR
jgi:hypothetical protein